MKEWTETEENTALLFEYYEGVIYNVLQRINLTKKNPAFDDFVQEGRILLMECYQVLVNEISLVRTSNVNCIGATCIQLRRRIWKHLH